MKKLMCVALILCLGLSDTAMAAGGGGAGGGGGMGGGGAGSGAGPGGGGGGVGGAGGVSGGGWYGGYVGDTGGRQRTYRAYHPNAYMADEGSCVGKVWNGREANSELKMFPPNDEVYWLVTPPQDPLRSCIVPETVPMAPCMHNGWCKISGTYEINYGAGGPMRMFRTPKIERLTDRRSRRSRSRR